MKCESKVEQRPVLCKECKAPDDHTWWCSIAPEVLPDGRRPYYWRD